MINIEIVLIIPDELKFEPKETIKKKKKNKKPLKEKND